MATAANERLATEQDGISPGRVARRDANRRASAAAQPCATRTHRVSSSSHASARRPTCERLVKVPLYVYRRMLADRRPVPATGRAPHPFAQYRTIISVGLVRIEERI